MCEETDSKYKNSVLQYGRVVSKDCFVAFTVSQFLYVLQCLNLMMVQTGQVPHTQVLVN